MKLLNSIERSKIDIPVIILTFLCLIVFSVVLSQSREIDDLRGQIKSLQQSDASLLKGTIDLALTVKNFQQMSTDLVDVLQYEIWEASQAPCQNVSCSGGQDYD